MSEKRSSGYMEETPITQLWDEVLAVPIVGTLDSERTQRVMEELLAQVYEQEAEIVIVDITGVSVMETEVARHISNITQAVQLMGAHCLISGLQPDVAQTMVDLNLNFEGVECSTTLKAALSRAFSELGYRVVKEEAP